MGSQKKKSLGRPNDTRHRMEDPVKAILCALSGLCVVASVGLSQEPVPTAAWLERWEKSVRYLMSLSETEMLEMIPTQATLYFVDCPNCATGTQETGVFDWSPERPHQIRCKGCGEEYPGNPKYPDERVLEVKGPDGPQQYPYYERAADKHKFFFRAKADDFAREYMASRCRELGELYAATKNETYAQRAALILWRFAQVYPGYAYHYEWPFQEKMFAPYDAKRDSEAMKAILAAWRLGAAKWGRWAYVEISDDLVRAYECIKGWPGLNAVGEGDAASAIENNLLGAMVGHVLDTPEVFSNMSPHMWRSVVRAGRVLERPEWIEEILRRMARFRSECFLHDGCWKETSPSYCAQTAVSMVEVVEALRDYVPPRRCPSADVSKIQQQITLAVGMPQRIYDVLYAMRFPDGRLLPVNDTWWFAKARERKRMEPVLLPGIGLSVLGGGSDEHQVHAYLNWTQGRGHKHADALSIGLFAFGKELFSDIGYTHTKYRPYAVSTASHNTVVVNGCDSATDASYTGQRLRSFIIANGWQVSEAESLTAYPATSRYRRTMMFIGEDARGCYLLDVFQVYGGAQHDYILLGCADEDSIARISGTQMSPFGGTLLNPGVTWRPPKGESDRLGPEAGYGFVTDLSEGQADGPVTLDMRLVASPALGTRTLLLPEKDTTIYLGQAPSIRRARHNLSSAWNESDELVERYRMPFFCARRKGTELRSVFVALHEPVSGRPKLVTASAERYADAVVVRVELDDGTRDVICIALAQSASILSEGLEFEGMYSLVRLRDDTVVLAHLAGGSRLVYGPVRLSGNSCWRGLVRRSVREEKEGAGGYLEVSEAIPPERAGLLGALIVRHPDATEHAYNIVGLETIENGTRIRVREDPAFVLTDHGTTRFVVYPVREIPGTQHHYEILDCASYPQEKPAPAHRGDDAESRRSEEMIRGY